MGPLAAANHEIGVLSRALARRHDDPAWYPIACRPGESHLAVRARCEARVGWLLWWLSANVGRPG